MKYKTRCLEGQHLEIAQSLMKGLWQWAIQFEMDGGNPEPTMQVTAERVSIVTGLSPGWIMDAVRTGYAHDEWTYVEV